MKIPYAKMTDVNQEEASKPSKWRDIVNFYSSSATIHGVSRIGEPRLYRFRPIIWTLLTLTMASILIAMLYVQFSKYTEYPTLTKLNAGFNKELGFPAVTVCNLNMFRRSIVNCTGLKNSDYMYHFFKTISDVGVLSGILAYAEDPRLPILGKTLQQCAFDYSYKLHEMVVYCVWDGTLQNCSDVFNTTLTHYGICHTFNKDIVSRKVTEASGSSSGLHILINIRQNEYFFSRTLQTGVKIMLHEPDEDPQPASRGIYVGPGLSAAIAVRKHQSTALPFPYKAFGSGICVDTHSTEFENPLVRYNRYSRSACLLECDIDELVRRCNCRFFLHVGDERLCTSREILKCYLAELHDTIVSKEYRNNCSCDSPCSETNYETTVSYSKFGSDFINGVLHDDGILKDLDSVEKNFIDMNVYYDSLVVSETVQVPEMTIGGILGSFGGLMGLFLGASLLSLSELIELLILLCMPLIKPRERK